MSSPPDLAPLRISSPNNEPSRAESSDSEEPTSKPQSQAVPSASTPEVKVRDTLSDTTQTNGTATPTPATPSTATPPPQSALPSGSAAPRPHPSSAAAAAAAASASGSNGASASSSSATRPAGMAHSVTSPPAGPSAPGIPRAGMGMAGRPGGAAGGPMAGRAGLQGPMGMGMRGGPQNLPAKLPPSLQAKMDKIAASRGSAPSPHAGIGPNPNATSMGALLRSQALGGGVGGGQQQAQQPSAQASSSRVPLPGPASGPLSLAARRGLAGGAPRPNLGAMGMPPSAPAGLGSRGGMAGRRMGPPGGLTLSQMSAGGAPGAAGGAAPQESGNKFTDFNQIMDPSGRLRFSKKAVLHAKGVDFEDGKSFSINMDELDIIGELGKGNYGSVQQVYHRPSGVMMAMKEIRLELDESKLNGIIMELDILHRAVAPEIVEFYGAFTIESCVYYCMEFMDAGSLDTLTGGGVPSRSAKEAEQTEEKEPAQLRVPEGVLRRITASMVRGLKFLKDELQIMHRDVKPTNVVINKKGEVKLVDFGVSGQLEKSLAKTNIGCQSYMAPERIKGESQNQQATYTVSSDVWSVGLTMIELAKGCYPYPPETFANVFAQLTAIVHGASPTLPEGYSADAQDFVAACLRKDPNQRPTYAQLMQHRFLLADKDADVDMPAWVETALARRASRGIIPLQEVEA